MLSLPVGSSVGPYLWVFLLAALVGLLATRAVRDLAIRRGWVAAPSLSRHVHRKPVPRIGGVAIYVSTWLVAAAIVAVLLRTDASLAYRALHRFVPIFIPATLIFVVGLIDDFRNLSARTKLAAQVAAGVLVYASGLRISHLDAIFGNSTLSPLVAMPLTVVWVIAITNAFNLIDGLDGLAAGTAFLSTAIVFVVSVFQHMPFIATLVAALAGSVLGFLRYNFNPASIFLGDSGSLYIGFLLSVAALAGSQKASTMVAVAIPVVSFGLPILDVSIAILRRFLRGRPLFEADAEHIHHKLLKRGFSHRDAVLILYGVSAVFGLLGLLLYPSGKLIMLVLAVIGLGVFFGLQQLRYHEFSELHRVAERTMNQKRVIANNLSIRRAADALGGCHKFIEIAAVIAEYLQPVGFSGFALETAHLSEIPESALVPFVRAGESVVQLGRTSSDASAFRLEFRLAPDGNGKWRSFSLSRTSCEEPLWLDANVFVASGFTSALDAALLRAVGAADMVESMEKATGRSSIDEAVPSLAIN